MAETILYRHNVRRDENPPPKQMTVNPIDSVDHSPSKQAPDPSAASAQATKPAAPTLDPKNLGKKEAEEEDGELEEPKPANRSRNGNDSSSKDDKPAESETPSSLVEQLAFGDELPALGLRDSPRATQPSRLSHDPSSYTQGFRRGSAKLDADAANAQMSVTVSMDKPGLPSTAANVGAAADLRARLVKTSSTFPNPAFGGGASSTPAPAPAAASASSSAPTPAPFKYHLDPQSRESYAELDA